MAPSSFPSARPASPPLTEKINIRVLDPFTIKPLDKKLILDSARATKGRIVTVEDHYYEGERARDTQVGRAGGIGLDILLYPSPRRVAAAQETQSSWDLAS